MRWKKNFFFFLVRSFNRFPLSLSTPRQRRQNQTHPSHPSHPFHVFNSHSRSQCKNTQTLENACQLHSQHYCYPYPDALWLCPICTSETLLLLRWRHIRFPPLFFRKTPHWRDHHYSTQPPTVQRISFDKKTYRTTVKARTSYFFTVYYNNTNWFCAIQVNHPRDPIPLHKHPRPIKKPIVFLGTDNAKDIPKKPPTSTRDVASLYQCLCIRLASIFYRRRQCELQITPPNPPTILADTSIRNPQFYI